MPTAPFSAHLYKYFVFCCKTGGQRGTEK